MEVRDGCVVSSAATATWRNVDVVDVQLLAIEHRNRNALLLHSEDRLTVEERPFCRRRGSCLCLALAGRRRCSCGGQVTLLSILAFSVT